MTWVPFARFSRAAGTQPCGWGRSARFSRATGTQLVGVAAVAVALVAPAAAAERDDVLTVDGAEVLSLRDLGVTPASPIVAAVPRRTGEGLWLVGRDGGVFALGDAPFLGTATAAAPVVAAVPVNDGMWVVSASGAVVSLGAIAPPRPLASAPTSPIVDSVRSGGTGLWLLARNGTIHSLGGAPELPAVRLGLLEAAVSLVKSGDGVQVLTGNGRVAGVGAPSTSVKVELPAVDQLPDGSVVESNGRVWALDGTITEPARCLADPVVVSATGGGSHWLVTSPKPAPATAQLAPLAALDAEHDDLVFRLRLAQACQRSGAALTIVDPLPGSRYTSRYGWRIHPIHKVPQFHRGLDLAGGQATARAAAAGEVVEVSLRVGYGNTVLIDHGNGWSTLYGHLAKASVSVGQQITAGAAVGRVGKTGFATGPHLHFEVRSFGQVVDPTPYVQAAR